MMHRLMTCLRCMPQPLWRHTHHAWRASGFLSSRPSTAALLSWHVQGHAWRRPGGRGHYMCILMMRRRWLRQYAVCSTTRLWGHRWSMPGVGMWRGSLRRSSRQTCCGSIAEPWRNIGEGRACRTVSPERIDLMYAWSVKLPVEHRCISVM